MPEVTGTVTARSPYGVKIDNSEEWYNFAKAEYRTEPWEADRAVKGTRVMATVDGKYICAIKVLADKEAPVVPQTPPEAPDTQVSQPWSYQHRDLIMFIASCTRGVCDIYAAALEAKTIDKIPSGGEVTAMERALEDHGIERLKARLAELS